MRVFPAIAEHGPVHRLRIANGLEWVEGKEALRKDAQPEALNPEVVYRMRQGPVRSVHRQQRKKGAQRQPERCGFSRCEEYEKQRCYQTAAFTHATADHESRIVDWLHAEVRVP